MMEMISRHYSKIMGGVAIAIVIIGTIFGGFWGSRFAIMVFERNFIIAFLGFILGAFLSFLLTYILVVMIFGFLAQVMSINTKLERIEKLIDERE